VNKGEEVSIRDYQLSYGIGDQWSPGSREELTNLKLKIPVAHSPVLRPPRTEDLDDLYARRRNALGHNRHDEGYIRFRARQPVLPHDVTPPNPMITLTVIGALDKKCVMTSDLNTLLSKAHGILVREGN
jgi:hypothetical protein